MITHQFFHLLLLVGDTCTSSMIFSLPLFHSFCVVCQWVRLMCLLSGVREALCSAGSEHSEQRTITLHYIAQQKELHIVVRAAASSTRSEALVLLPPFFFSLRGVPRRDTQGSSLDLLPPLPSLIYRCPAR
jgi:hypothetical protein